jgi:hypothetical protein
MIVSYLVELIQILVYGCKDNHLISFSRRFGVKSFALNTKKSRSWQSGIFCWYIIDEIFLDQVERTH